MKLQLQFTSLLTACTITFSSSAAISEIKTLTVVPIPVPSTTVQPEEVPSAVAAGGETYWLTPNGVSAGQDLDAKNRVGTYLFGFEGCDGGKKGKINEAYYDQWVMSNIDGVKENIDWNSAVALEYFGGPGMNQEQQQQIQAVFANIATVIYSRKNPLFQHALHVRCDDPKMLCQNRRPDDSCSPDPDKPEKKPLPTPYAYAMNPRSTDDKYPLINFCDGFMNSRSLKDGYARGSSLLHPANLDVNEYHNRANMFFHELTHLWLAADSQDDKPNPAIYDFLVLIKRSGRVSKPHWVYGAAMTKVLARNQKGTGRYTQRNADNYAFYALAKYIMSKNGNVYPHLPLVHQENEGLPYRGSSTPQILVFSNDTGSLTLDDENFDSEGLNPDSGGPMEYPGCSDFPTNTGTDAGSVIDLDGLTPLSEYPPNYVSQVMFWERELMVVGFEPSDLLFGPDGGAQ